MLRKLGTALCFTALAVLVGCSGFDSTQVLMHPEEVKPAETFDVAFVNIYTYLNNDTIVTTNITRDSLHVLVGMPEGWSVESAAMVVADDITTSEMMALQDNMSDPQVIMPLLLKYQNKVVMLTADAGLVTQFTGDSMLAHDRTNTDEIMVTSTGVPQWKGFGGAVNILIENGSKPDTVIPIDSMLELAGASGTLDDSTAAMIESMKTNPMMPKNIGMTMIPVIVLLKVKAGTVEGTDTLYYFSKTGSMTIGDSPLSLLVTNPDDLAMLNDLESGDMAFMPVKVTPTASVVTAAAQRGHGAFGAAADRTKGTVTFTVPASSATDPVVSIYSLQGALVTSLIPQGSTAVWNGCNRQGMHLPVGAYIARFGNASATVHLMR